MGAVGGVPLDGGHARLARPRRVSHRPEDRGVGQEAEADALPFQHSRLPGRFPVLSGPGVGDAQAVQVSQGLQDGVRAVVHVVCASQGIESCDGQPLHRRAVGVEPSRFVGDLNGRVRITALAVAEAEVRTVEDLLRKREGYVRVGGVPQVDVADQDKGEGVALQTDPSSHFCLRRKEMKKGIWRIVESPLRKL